jgi:hypothetical protein
MQSQIAFTIFVLVRITVCLLSLPLAGESWGDGRCIHEGPAAPFLIHRSLADIDIGIPSFLCGAALPIL